MICKKCGSEMKEGDVFCEKCGAKNQVKSEPIRIKFTYLIIAIIAIIFIISIGILIYNNSNSEISAISSVNQNTENIKETSNNVSNLNDEKKDEVYTSFSGDIETAKNTFDAWWNKMTTENKITYIKSKEWQVYKQQVSPYMNLAIKEFYVFENQEFAIVSIGYDDNGNVINIKFSGISPITLEQKYNSSVVLEYHYIMFSIPQILKFITNDEEISKYLQEEMAYCFDNNSWYLNETKQGLEFSIGGDANNYLNVEVCLEEYAQN